MARTMAQKLLVKPGTTLYVWPAARLGPLGPLPDGVRVTDTIDDATVAVLFVDDEATLRTTLATLAADLGKPEILWLCYPKGGRADINRDSLWPIVAQRVSMRPITNVAIDETWSALRFRPLRPDEAPPRAGG